MLSIEIDLRQQMLQISLSWGLIPPSAARLADQSSLRDYSCRIGNEGAALAKISILKNYSARMHFFMMIGKFWIKKNQQATNKQGKAVAVLSFFKLMGSKESFFSSKDTIEPVTFAHLKAFRSQEVGTRGWRCVSLCALSSQPLWCERWWKLRF